MFEWELKAESWTDEHPHCEYNYVIEGQLFVDSGGVTVEALAGDVVRVPAGATGRYWAPRYARLLGYLRSEYRRAQPQLGLREARRPGRQGATGEDPVTTHRARFALLRALTPLLCIAY
jgi:hypothetical protein